MAIVLKNDITTNESGTALLLTDTTGAYNISNTGGYGTPNPATSTFTADSCVITTPATSLQPTGSAFTITLYPDFPTTDETLEISIASSQLGQGTGALLATGIYKFERTATSTTDYTYTNYYLFFPKVRQAVWQLNLASALDTSTAVQQMLDMVTLIDLAWSYGETEKATYTLQKLINNLAKYGKTNLY